MDIFGIDALELSTVQACARAVLIFAYGLLLVRLAGPRLFGKWSAVDVIVSIIVGSNLSRAMTGSAPLLATLAATTVLIGLHWVLSHAVARWRPLSRILEGRAVDLGREGQLSHAMRTRHAISETDLAEALRQRGVERMEETRKVTLEPSGKISVLKRE